MTTDETVRKEGVVWSRSKATALHKMKNKERGTMLRMCQAQKPIGTRSQAKVSGGKRPMITIEDRWTRKPSRRTYCGPLTAT